MVNKTVSEFYKRNQVLTSAGFLVLALFPVMLILSTIDTRTVAGINTWFKPMKFSLAIGTYMLTFAWIMHYLNISARRLRVISWGIALSMTLEILLIIFQASRGVPSHYNVTSSLDKTIFDLMGIFVGINTLFVIYVGALFLFARKKTSHLRKDFLWLLRLGLLLFIFSSAVGAKMIGLNSHSVGVEQANLPFINWNITGGDLRVAHFLGIHGIQIMLVAWYLLRRYTRGKAGSISLSLAVALCLATLFLFFQAQAGIPFFQLP